MTLKDYYKALPKSNSPKKDLIQTISRECSVSEQTARNWCIYGMKPQDYRHVRLLSKLTGIKEEDLWI